MARVGVTRLARLTSRRGAATVVTCAAMMVGCDGRPPPTAPTSTSARVAASSAGPATLHAVGLERMAALSAPDGATLKATAPTPLSPIADTRADGLDPVLTVNNAQGRFVTAQFRYRFSGVRDTGEDDVALIDTGAVDEGSGLTRYMVG